jgi:hypothetical protein
VTNNSAPSYIRRPAAVGVGDRGAPGGEPRPGGDSGLERDDRGAERRASSVALGWGGNGYDSSFAPRFERECEGARERQVAAQSFRACAGRHVRPDTDIDFEVMCKLELTVVTYVFQTLSVGSDVAYVQGDGCWLE